MSWAAVPWAAVSWAAVLRAAVLRAARPRRDGLEPSMPGSYDVAMHATALGLLSSAQRGGVITVPAGMLAAETP